MNTMDRKNAWGNEQRKKQKVKAAQDFAKKTVNTVEGFKDAIGQNAAAVKNSAVNVAQKTAGRIKDVQEKTIDVKNDIKGGYHKVAKDIQKTAHTVSGEFGKTGK